MRIFASIDEAMREFKRIVSEMGVLIDRKSYQSIETKNTTREVLMVDSCIRIRDNPKSEMADQSYCSQEVRDRICGSPNPGNSWKLRKNIWEPLLEESGRFSYTYSSRMSEELEKIIKILKESPQSRQCYLPIFRIDDLNVLEKSRVPCSLGYQFIIQDQYLDVVYVMRSADVVTHLANDLQMAAMISHHVAKKIGKTARYLYNIIFNLHSYVTNLKGVF